MKPILETPEEVEARYQFATQAAAVAQLGDIRWRYQVGLRGRDKVIWGACPQCGKTRWIRLKHYELHDGQPLCAGCVAREWQKSDVMMALRRAPKPALSERQRGANNPGWKGGRKMISGKYTAILVAPDDPLRCMGDTKGYVLEHRAVMARHLGRLLERYETVHHRNGDPQDNRLENLEIWVGNHGPGVRASDYHCPGCRCGHQGTAAELRREIAELQAKLKELQSGQCANNSAPGHAQWGWRYAAVGDDAGTGGGTATQSVLAEYDYYG